MAEQEHRLGARTIGRRELLRLAGLGGVGLLAAACGAAPTPEKVVETVVVKETVVVEGTPKVVEKVVEKEVEKVVTPTPAPAVAEKQKVQLYTLVWQPAAVEATHKAVDDWNAANKDRIEVEYIQGDWGNARDYLTTSISGGVVPEVIQGITMWANQYGTQGGYLDLTEMIKGSDLGTDIHPIALSAATSPLDNKIYSLPWCWETGMMYVNADRFKEQGIEVPKEWTWEDFLAIAMKVTKPPEYYGLAANLSTTQTTEDIIAWMWQTGAEVMGEIAGAWKIDIEPAREALILWHDMLHKDQIISPDSFGATDIMEAFPLGSYSMIQTGCWGRRMVIEAKPQFQWNMIPLPYHKRHANSSEPQTWSIATQTNVRGNTKAAWEVTEWLSNKENSSNISYGDWLFPTRQTAMADPRFTTDELGWSLALKELQYGHAYPKHPAWAEFDDRVLGPNIQKYLQDELSLDELMNLLLDEGNKLLAQYTKK